MMFLDDLERFQPVEVVRRVGAFDAGSLGDLVSTAVAAGHRFLYGEICVHLVELHLEDGFGLVMEWAIRLAQQPCDVLSEAL